MRFFNLFISLLFPLILKGQLHTYRSFNHLDGLNISNILSLEQDEKGYLWMGTAGNGLIRYDGEFFKDFDQPDNSMPYHVSDFIIDKDETFYLTTLFTGVLTFKNGTYKELISSKNFNELIHHIEIFQDHLFVFSELNVYVFDKKGKKISVNKLEQDTQNIRHQYLTTPIGILVFNSNGCRLVSNKYNINLKKFF